MAKTINNKFLLTITERRVDWQTNCLTVIELCLGAITHIESLTFIKGLPVDRNIMNIHTDSSFGQDVIHLPLHLSAYGLAYSDYI